MCLQASCALAFFVQSWFCVLAHLKCLFLHVTSMQPVGSVFFIANVYVSSFYVFFLPHRSACSLDDNYYSLPEFFFCAFQVTKVPKPKRWGSFQGSWCWRSTITFATAQQRACKCHQSSCWPSRYPLCESSCHKSCLICHASNLKILLALMLPKSP